jgi:hypothetical protein
MPHVLGLWTAAEFKRMLSAPYSKKTLDILVPGSTILSGTG